MKKKIIDWFRIDYGMGKQVITMLILIVLFTGPFILYHAPPGFAERRNRTSDWARWEVRGIRIGVVEGALHKRKQATPVVAVKGLEELEELSVFHRSDMPCFLENPQLFLPKK